MAKSRVSCAGPSQPAGELARVALAGCRPGARPSAPSLRCQRRGRARPGGGGGRRRRRLTRRPVAPAKPSRLPNAVTTTRPPGGRPRTGRQHAGGPPSALPPSAGETGWGVAEKDRRATLDVGVCQPAGNEPLGERHRPVRGRRRAVQAPSAAKVIMASWSPVHQPGRVASADDEAVENDDAAAKGAHDDVVRGVGRRDGEGLAVPRRRGAERDRAPHFAVHEELDLAALG